MIDEIVSEMASEGKIGAKEVAQSLVKMHDDVQKAFDSTDATIASFWTKTKNFAAAHASEFLEGAMGYKGTHEALDEYKRMNAHMNRLPQMRE